MIYDVLSRSTVKITLTVKDMREYALKPEYIRTRTAETKRALANLLGRLREKREIFPDKRADRLFLEAFPSDDGGCVMYVSTLGTEYLPAEDEIPADRTDTAYVMCIAEGLDTAVHLCAGLSERAAVSDLYRFGESFCLTVAADTRDIPYIARICGEYGEFSDDAGDIACVAEHGTLIFKSNAVSLLSRLI